MSYHERRTIRLKNYDYSSDALYYVTICTTGNNEIFGGIKNGRMLLNEYGIIARKEWFKTARIRTYVDLDAFIILPDHIHGIIVIKNQKFDQCRGMACHAQPIHSTFVNRKFSNPINQSLSSIIGCYKSSVTREINKLRSSPGRTIWQRNYYEHIIRNEKELFAARKYIMNNPKKYK
jgi:REP element-mobilizing transposase RayT